MITFGGQMRDLIDWGTMSPQCQHAAYRSDLKTSICMSGVEWKMYKEFQLHPLFTGMLLT